MSKNNKNDNNKDKKPGNSNMSQWLLGAVVVLLIGINLFNISNNQGTQHIDLNRLVSMVSDQDVDKIIVVNKEKARVFLKNDALKKETYKDANVSEFLSTKNPNYIAKFGSLEVFENRINQVESSFPLTQRVQLEHTSETNWMDLFLSVLFPILLIVVIWVFIMRRFSGGGGAGGQIFNIGKSKATLFDNKKVDVTFENVAGLDEAKEEVMEVVDFLKTPEKYTSLGGKIPKGVLLVGPPGTGKTLLAKAVAGEAGVPFFSISGSDFVEMFVGVGASRVRDLFKQARDKAPCIVFIDEIDAIGRARGKNAMQGGNDERENTLNQLLVEMDGFATDKGVIMMAATNRPDILDSALMRPGRFDRQIGIDRPDIVGREAIFKVHLKSIKTEDSIGSRELAEMTPGFAGAEIANVCNEAALVAARRNRKAVSMDDFNYALDRVIGGLEKKNKLISPAEKEIIAYHEAGHAICGWFLEHASPLVKVTIVPRGIGTLGYAQYLPREEYLQRTEQLLDRMCMTLGGRAAEDLVFGKISTGAQNDLDQVTKMAFSMVAIYGMSPKIGQVSYYDMMNNSPSKPYSEETGNLMDTEIRDITNKEYTRAKALLTEKRAELELLAQELLKKEVLLKSDVERLVGARPFIYDEEIRPEAASSSENESKVEPENNTESSSAEDDLV